MSPAQIALLGAIAGLTILLGLPLARLRAALPRTKALLNAIATGILVFLLFDVLQHAWAPIDEGLGKHEVASALGNGTVLTISLGAGLLGLVYFDRMSARRRVRPGPGAAAVGELPVSTWRTQGGQLAMMIAIGIGLHNFAEGLAIGNSAATGAMSLALLLIIGFGLHNATEGFGIVAPLTGDRPSWGQLLVLGLIGGVPTFIGTMVGQSFTNATMSIAFLGLAAGSILYVVIELLAVARKMQLKEITTWGIFLGLFLGFVTDGIVAAAGA